MAAVNPFDPRAVPSPVRYPLVTPLSTRTATNVLADGLQVNCFSEKQADGRELVIKRSGLSQRFSFAGGVGGITQGLYAFKGYLLGAINNILYKVTTPVTNSSASGTAFTQATVPTWKARYYFNAVVFNNQIFVLGGFDTVNTFNDVWSSPDGEVWTQLSSATPFGARQAAQAIVFNGRLYVIGGVRAGATYLSDVWVSDDGVSWTSLTDDGGFPGRAGHRCVVYNNGIFLMGGVNTTGYLNDVWFSTDGSSWTKLVLNAAWGGRSDFGIAVTQGNLVIWGGSGGGGLYYNDCYSTLDGITWTLRTAAAFAAGTAYPAYTVYEDRLWSIAGETAAATENSKVYQSADIGATWGLITAAPGFGNRHGSSAVAFRAPPGVSSIRTPTLWVLGGTNLATVKREVWRGDINNAVNASWTIPTSSAGETIDWTTANANEFLVLKDSLGMYCFRGNVLQKVTDANYPTKTVPGVVNLDETVYVMDLNGVIFGCSLENPLVWPGFNFIGADYESDAGVAITKYRDYVLAFGEFTTQLFFNSGSQFGSLLRPVKNGNSHVGCKFASSIANCDDVVAWVGRNQLSRDLQVYVMAGYQPKAISTPVINRLLSTQSTIVGMFFKADGHRFYVMLLATSNISIAVDVDTGLWFQITWQNVAWRHRYYTTDGTDDFYMPNNLATTYGLTQGTYFDVATPVSWQVITNPVDGGTRRAKFLRKLILVGDRANIDIAVSYSDDDYTTFSTPRTLNMNSERPTLNRLGRFRRRAFKLTNSDAVAVRMEALELEVDVGVS